MRFPEIMWTEIEAMAFFLTLDTKFWMEHSRKSVIAMTEYRGHYIQ